MAGKGDRNRVTDFSAYQRGYDRIFKHKATRMTEKQERHPKARNCSGCGMEPIITTDSQGVATVRCDPCGRSTSGWTRRDSVYGWNEVWGEKETER